MNFGIRPQSVRFLPEFVAFGFRPKTEIEDHIAPRLQNFYGDFPHQFFDLGMPRIVLPFVYIMPEKKILPLVGR